MAQTAIAVLQLTATEVAWCIANGVSQRRFRGKLRNHMENGNARGTFSYAP
jgi:hypothetical protein